MSIATELSFYFSQLLAETAVPAADTLENLIVLIRNGAVEKYFPYLKGTHSETSKQNLLEIQENYRKNPEESEKRWDQLLADVRADYRNTARKKLDTLTNLVLVGTFERKQAESLNLQFDNSNQLLELSIAEATVSRIHAATERAGRLIEWSVGQPSSEEADQYLSEACSCFIYGFFTASAVMCRSLLEEVFERKLPQRFLNQGVLVDQNKRTLGALLKTVNDNFSELRFDAKVPKYSRYVNETGSRAAHRGNISEDEALKCLKDTREVISCLLA